MIKVNLCPVDELESPYWYIPDVVALAVVALAAYLGVQHYLGTIQEQIDSVVAETDQKKQAAEALKPQIAQFETLGKDIEELNTKLKSLQSITVSKISRYKPVIIMEHMQNLKPEGLWFESFRIGGEGKASSFELKGKAFDNLLVAEMMTAMKSTASQEKDDADMRTQVHFDEVRLRDSIIGGDAAGFPELKGFPVFVLEGSFAEYSSGARPEAGGGPTGTPAAAPGGDAPPPDAVPEAPPPVARATLKPKDKKVF